MEGKSSIKIYNKIDAFFKFPNLKSGDTGIQIGFDLSSPNLTSDLIRMCRRVGKNGLVIGIDPDPSNHERITPIIKKYKLPVILVQKGTYSETKKAAFVLAKRASWNKIEEVAGGETQNFTDNRIDVDLDTLDNILNELNIDKSKIKHINITNNGAEYGTLVGAKALLKQSNNLALTVVAGRSGDIGKVNEMRDYQAINQLFKALDYNPKFYRQSDLIWWGFFNKLLNKREWVYGKKPYGVVLANKGNSRPFYQSFS